MGDNISKEGNYTGIVVSGIALFLLFLFIFRLAVNSQTLWSLMGDIIKNNLGSVIVQNLKQNLLFSVVMGGFAFLFLFLMNMIFSKYIKKPKLITIFTISLIVLIFFFGFFSINNVMGYSPIKFNLQEGFGNGFIARGLIECHGKNEIYFVHQNISCNFKQDIIMHNITTNARITLENDTDLLFNGSSSQVNFTAPENTIYVSFSIAGLDRNNNSRHFSVGYPYRFLSLEDYEINKRIFLGAIISLLILLFVTIPSTINSIKQIWKED